MPSSPKKKMRVWLNKQLFLMSVYLMSIEWGTSEERWILDQVDDFMVWTAYLASVRTLTPPIAIEKTTSYAELVFRLPEKEFRQALRVEKMVFAALVDLIREDVVFQSRSSNQQRPIQIQLAVMLERLGTYGNGGSVGKLARAYGIGAGTVTLYARRVVQALLRHYGKFVEWPKRLSRIATSAYYGARFGMEGAVGFVDGTHFIFSQKPGIDGEAYFNRKKRYSINAMIACDGDKRIICALIGWPGSCADSTVFSKSQLAECPEKYFSADQFLVGDSGYQLTQRMLVPYKKPDALRPDNASYNTILASARVVNENCIGLLKNRWVFLKGISSQVREKKDFTWVNAQCMACILLHNFAIVYHDTRPFESDDDDDDEGDDDHTGMETHEGHELRARVKRVC